MRRPQFGSLGSHETFISLSTDCSRLLPLNNGRIWHYQSEAKPFAASQDRLHPCVQKILNIPCRLNFRWCSEEKWNKCFCVCVCVLVSQCCRVNSVLLIRLWLDLQAWSAPTHCCVSEPYDSVSVWVLLDYTESGFKTFVIGETPSFETTPNIGRPAYRLFITILQQCARKVSKFNLTLYYHNLAQKSDRLYFKPKILSRWSCQSPIDNLNPS